MAQENNDRVELIGDTVVITLAPMQDARTVESTVDAVRKLSGTKKYDLLVDGRKISETDGTGLPMAKELAFHIPYRRCAVFGANPRFANLNIKELFAVVDDPEHVKYFRKEEDARAWLQE